MQLEPTTKHAKQNNSHKYHTSTEKQAIEQKMNNILHNVQNNPDALNRNNQYFKYIQQAQRSNKHSTSQSLTYNFKYQTYIQQLLLYNMYYTKKELYNNLMIKNYQYALQNTSYIQITKLKHIISQTTTRQQTKLYL